MSEEFKIKLLALAIRFIEQIIEKILDNYEVDWFTVNWKRKK